MRKRSLWAGGTVLLVVALAAAITVAAYKWPISGGVSAQDRANELFAEEQQESAGVRAARNWNVPPEGEHVPHFGAPQEFAPVNYLKTKGWDGERPFGAGNDWEPDIAADPNSSYVYVITTRFGKDARACDDCPLPAFVYRVSNDNGATWGPEQYLCRCEGVDWQYDPQLVVSDDGTVYATILSSDWHTYLTKSSNHGQTWTTPVDVAPSQKWTDHGGLTVSPDGQDVYVAFNQADSYVVASHDGGATWGDPVRTNPTSAVAQYYYHYQGSVMPDGTVNIPATSVNNENYATHLVRYYDLRSTDGGATWQQVWLDTFKEQPYCVKHRCRKDHLAGMIHLSADGSTNLVAAYAGTRIAQHGQMIYTSTSTDGGATWFGSKRVSPEFVGTRRVIASFPQIAGTGSCDFRLWWMDDRKNIDSWNTWFTRSTDCGATWGAQVRISDAASGAGYKHPAGYFADYGDYGGISIMSDGRTIATWGEAYSYWGPGGTWVNEELPHI